MEVLAGPALIIVPGLIALVWSVIAVRRVRAPHRWTRVQGWVAAHERDAAGEVVDLIGYPLPDGGTHALRPLPHGEYTSGRPIGSAVSVWRDPHDPVHAVAELPGLDRFAGALLAGILGGFAVFAGLVWSVLILVLVNR